MILVLVVTCLGGRFGVNHPRDLFPKLPEPNMWLLICVTG